MNSLLLVDGYKIGHHKMYQDGIEKVYSNFTPRSNKYAPQGNNGKVLNFGQQAVIKYIVDHFNNNFFNKPKEEVISEIKKELSMYLGTDYDTTHFEKLHDLQYLPIKVKSLPEGTESAIKIPVLTIVNTHDDFAWLTNYLETIISNLLWQPITSATTALIYRKTALEWVNNTDPDNIGLVDWMLHDFSMRGLTGLDAAIFSGMAHAAVFKGSDTLPAIHGARKYYNETDFVVGSVAASEHSQMTAQGPEGEFEVFERLISTHPTGILSLVSDSFDLWNVITNYLPRLKDKIIARDGKLVIRPDSGDPVDIICGLNIQEYESLDEAKRDFEDNLSDNQVHGEMEFDCDTEITIKVADKYYILKENVDWNRYDKQYYFIEDHGTIVEEIPFKPEFKGVIELIWNIFGGSINEQGYKVLNPHIGVIQGEAVDPQTQVEIYRRLAEKGFATTNIFIGIGSYAYQYKTRDSWGIACKCTAQQIDGKLIPIFKDPITDSGMKKSAKGLLAVHSQEGEYVLQNNCTWEEESKGLLQTIYEDGLFFNQTSLTEIRERINK